MTYNEDIIQKVVSCGTLGYPVSKIINILDISDEQAFINDFNNADSQIARAYQKGVDKADFAIDQKLFELARGGNMQAIEKFEIRKKFMQRKTENEKKNK